VVGGVEDLTKPVGTAKAKVPRGYLFPADLDFIAEKLRTHNVKVDVLTQPIKATGEEFVIDKLVKDKRGGFNMTTLEGGFATSAVKEFPAGTYRVDLAQPTAGIRGHGNTAGIQYMTRNPRYGLCQTELDAARGPRGRAASFKQGLRDLRRAGPRFA